MSFLLATDLIQLWCDFIVLFDISKRHLNVLLKLCTFYNLCLVLLMDVMY